MKTNPEIDAVDRLLQKLRVEFERYFNGALDLPPLEMQNVVAVKIRDLRSKTRSSVDNFRLNTLEAKANTYNEMFNRPPNHRCRLRYCRAFAAIRAWTC